MDPLSDASIDDTFACAVCIERFSYHDITVVQLPCQHQLCYLCYHGLTSSRCPFCRQCFEMELRPPHTVVESWERNLQKWIKEAVDEYMETAMHLQTYQTETIVYEPTFWDIALAPTVGRGRRRRRRRSGSANRVVPVPMDI